MIKTCDFIDKAGCLLDLHVSLETVQQRIANSTAQFRDWARQDNLNLVDLKAIQQWLRKKYDNSLLGLVLSTKTSADFFNLFNSSMYYYYSAASGSVCVVCQHAVCQHDCYYDFMNWKTKHLIIPPPSFSVEDYDLIIRELRDILSEQQQQQHSHSQQSAKKTRTWTDIYSEGALTKGVHRLNHRYIIRFSLR